MSAESNAEAGIPQQTHSSTVRRILGECDLHQDWLDDALGYCGAAVLAICAIPLVIIAVILPTVFELALMAFNGFLFLITGHLILRAVFEGYLNFPLQDSMRIGAVGAVIMFPVVIVFSVVIACCVAGEQDLMGNHRDLSSPNMCSPNPGFIFQPGITTVFGGAAGYLGSTVLLLHGYTMMDPLHAAGAGALGGTVLGPGILFAMFAVFAFTSCCHT